MSDSSDQRAFLCGQFISVRITVVPADSRLLNQIYGLYDEAINDKESEIFEITRNIQQIENVLNVVSKYGCAFGHWVSHQLTACASSISRSEDYVAVMHDLVRYHGHTYVS